MAQVVIRNLDDRVLSALKRRAELHGRSLEQELRAILSAAAVLPKHKRSAMVNRIRALTPEGVKQTDSTLLIRQDRDRR